MLLPLALVVGGIVGAWGPSEELRSLKKIRTEESVAAGKARGFDAFARMVNIPDVAKHRRPRSRKPELGATNAVSAAAQPAPEAAGAKARPEKPDRRRLNPEDLRARIDEAVELWRTRSELVRTRALEKLGLDRKGEAGFDDAIAKMNESIRDSMQALADELASAEEFTPELGVRLMGDVSVTIAEAYDRIAENAGEGNRGEVSRIQLVELVDPSAFEPLVGVQDKLEAFPRWRERR